MLLCFLDFLFFRFVALVRLQNPHKNDWGDNPEKLKSFINKNLTSQP